jgi:hypothetical protein
MRSGSAGSVVLWCSSKTDIDELGGIGSQPRGEQQVAVLVGEIRIDERPWLAVQRVPRDELAEFGGQ